MSLRSRLLCALAAALIANTVRAGGSGVNVVVVVNQNSTNSIQLANSYCEQRSVPPQNVLRLSYQWSGGSVDCDAGEFQDELLAPLLSMLQSRNLTNQIQYVLLSMDIPYELGGTNGVNSTTSALFYGFKPDGPPVSGFASCSLPDDSSNSYAFSELPFAEGAPNTAATNSFLAVLLTDTNLANAELTLTRGVASDSTFPTQTVYLIKTDDAARNVRFVEFDDAVFETRVHGGYSMIRTNTDETSFPNLLGFETGSEVYSEATNDFVPGAIADSLTSYGGDILNTTGQTTALVSLEAGACASYGTVVEPCNYTQKFPNPLDYFYQARGFSLAEAYYQSILNPYQGIMVGEPLSAPFARRGQGFWEHFPAGTPLLSGQTNLQLQFAAAATNLPLSQVDLFVDGTWFETLTNIPPAPGDALSVTLNGQTVRYTVPSQATPASVASGLAAALNEASASTLVGVEPWGDRLDLLSLNTNLPGVETSLSASATNNAGAAATFLTPALPTFLDTIATGYHYLLVSNAPVVGDWLQLVVTKTNGTSVTLAVTNTASGTTIGQLLQTLYNDVNNTPALQLSDGIYAGDYNLGDYVDGVSATEWILYAQTPGLPASEIQVTMTASPDLGIDPPGTSLLQDNITDLLPRNHLYVASGRLSLPVSWTLDTTQLADGYHQLTAVAYEGTSVRTQTIASQNVQIQNTGLSATLNTLYGGSNTDLGATLQFSVVANTNNVSTIDLYSIGGLLGSATNESIAYFSVPGSNLGLGLLPFYAIVTDNAGHQYRTATTWIRLIGPEPPISISVGYPPISLHWSATAGRSYNVLMSTNLSGPFQIAATLTPSNSFGAWIDTSPPATERFYLVETSN